MLLIKNVWLKFNFLQELEPVEKIQEPEPVRNTYSIYWMRVRLLTCSRVVMHCFAFALKARAKPSKIKNREQREFSLSECQKRWGAIGRQKHGLTAGSRWGKGFEGKEVEIFHLPFTIVQKGQGADGKGKSAIARKLGQQVSLSYFRKSARQEEGSYSI